MKVSVKLITLMLPVVLAGCQSTGGGGQLRTSEAASIQEQYIETDQPDRLGREHFTRGNYALSERYFQAAVERTPQDGGSWIGLAASYDQLGRFDLADRAYEQATRIKGRTAQVLNNRGYSYLLRGDAARANVFFKQAISLSPETATIKNNMTILEQTQPSS